MAPRLYLRGARGSEKERSWTLLLAETRQTDGSAFGRASAKRLAETQA